MLDKSVPYASLRMRRAHGVPIPEFPLPQGFKFKMYRDGDERDWARIETSVDEFGSEFAALMHFREKFIPEAEELSRRLIFIETDDGKKVATANAWWSIIGPERAGSLKRFKEWLQNGTNFVRNSVQSDTQEPPSENQPIAERRAWLHWVAVDAAYQGLGLGKAVVSRAMQVMREIEGDVDMYLSTQTWSYKAIGIYKKCGFEPTDEKILYSKRERNDFDKAMKILEKLK